VALLLHRHVVVVHAHQLISLFQLFSLPGASWENQ
jgi:hypothetical protein